MFDDDFFEPAVSFSKYETSGTLAREQPQRVFAEWLFGTGRMVVYAATMVMAVFANAAANQPCAPLAKGIPEESILSSQSERELFNRTMHAWEHRSRESFMTVAEFEARLGEQA